MVPVIERPVMMKQYDFTLAMSANISEAVVKEMITSIVEKQTGKAIKSMDAVVVDGKFNGYTVVFDTLKKTQSFKSSKQFVVDNFGADE